MIISTTITNSRADVVREALATIAPEVDYCMVIDTGATDNTMKIAADVLGPKLIARTWPWQNDFAAARNFALDEARRWLRNLRNESYGGAAQDPRDWIVTADTDEWLRVPGLRGVLAGIPPQVDVVMVPHVTRTYRQTRIIRATCPGRWSMPVHEWFGPYTGANPPPELNWHFECQPRPTEDRTAKYTHYRAVLEREAERDPENPRVWYYLADTLSILGYRGSAVRAFERCWRLPGWDDQAAWACYRGAILLFEMGLLQQAIDMCSRGLTRSRLPELFWLRGWLYGQRGDWAQAAIDAQTALECPPRDRAGFSFPAAQTELPAQLLAHARVQLAQAPADPPVEASEESSLHEAGTLPAAEPTPDR